MRIQKAQKHMDPTDPDPQHSVLYMYLLKCSVYILWVCGVWPYFFVFSQIERIKKREGVYRERVSAAGVKVCNFFSSLTSFCQQRFHYLNNDLQPVHTVHVARVDVSSVFGIRNVWYRCGSADPYQLIVRILLICSVANIVRNQFRCGIDSWRHLFHVKEFKISENCRRHILVEVDTPTDQHILAGDGKSGSCFKN